MRLPAAPRSVVFATLNFPPKRGGIEQLCAELAREFVNLGVPLHVVAPQAKGSAEFDATAPYPITRYAAGPLRDWNLSREIGRLVRAGHDCVLFGQWTAAPLALLGRRATGRPRTVITLAHGKELINAASGERSSGLYRRYRRAVLAELTSVLAVSEYSATHARLAGARDVHVVHPGVDATRFSPSDRTAAPLANAQTPGPLILSVARLVARKGIDTLISALPALSRMQPNLRCVVAGDGPDRGRLQTLASSLGVEKCVSFLGEIDDDQLRALYVAADVFVLLSREDPTHGDVEGFGLVLLEAQASGTPVVAASSGGMADAFLPGKTGLLVQPDNPQGLAAELGRLLGDEARLRTLSAAAREYACTQTWRASAEHVLRIIDAKRRLAPTFQASPD